MFIYKIYNLYCTSSEENVTCNMSRRGRNVIEVGGGANIVLQANSSFCSKGEGLDTDYYSSD